MPGACSLANNTSPFSMFQLCSVTNMNCFFSEFSNLSSSLFKHHLIVLPHRHPMCALLLLLLLLFYLLLLLILFIIIYTLCSKDPIIIIIIIRCICACIIYACITPSWALREMMSLPSGVC